MTKTPNTKYLHIDMFLNMRPELIVKRLSERSDEELLTFRQQLDNAYHSQVKPLLKMANKQIYALQGDEEEVEKINANLLVISALAQKIEDVIHIINELLDPPF